MLVEQMRAQFRDPKVFVWRVFDEEKRGLTGAGRGRNVTVGRSVVWCVTTFRATDGKAGLVDRPLQGDPGSWVRADRQRNVVGPSRFCLLHSTVWPAAAVARVPGLNRARREA